MDVKKIDEGNDAPTDVLEFTRLEKNKIGKICKSFIDAGRLEYLKQFYPNSYLTCYVSECITPENLMFVSGREN